MVAVLCAQATQVLDGLQLFCTRPTNHLRQFFRTLVFDRML